MQKTMEMLQYIECLRKPNKKWYFSKDYTQEKINALNKIAIEGYPSTIYDLIEFLKDNNKEIREATYRTISHLFNKIESKRGYYGALKYCGISQTDIDFYEKNFTKDQFVELLAICSLNYSGYVREKAVKKLSSVKSSRAIQFLIYRLADWVLQVRQAAFNGIDNYKKPFYIESLIENLTIFMWLQKVERVNLNKVYHEILEYIATTNRTYVIDNFKKFPDKQRLLLAQHISSTIRENSLELKLLLLDKHFLIRCLVLNHFDKLGQVDIELLLNDKSPKVRLQTLYYLEGQNIFEVKVKNFLADNSASIRYFARFTLRELNINYAKLYNDNLMNNRKIIGSLYGLAEVGNNLYTETIKLYLNDKNVKVKKAAFLALCKTDEEDAFRFALSNIVTPIIELRKAIIEYLSKFPRNEVLSEARSIYNNGDYELKKSMLILFSKVGGWAAIPDLIKGAIGDDENIRQLAFHFLSIWRAKAVRLFTKPKLEEIDNARELLTIANKILKEKQYFKINPLEGLEFYFKLH